MATLTYKFAPCGSFRHAGVALLALACLLGSAWARDARLPDEFQIKAAALYNVITFTDWPASAFSAPDSPLIVGILGYGPVAAALEKLVGSETRRGRRIVSRSLQSAAEARACHVLYIARSEHDRWQSIRSRLANLPILTASDAENFAHEGGMVQFAMERDKLRLIVNLDAARARGLLISSKVLRLAEVIEDGRP